MDKNFDIRLVIEKLKEKRKVFISEKDFQEEMITVIEEEYPNAKIRMEYSPKFDIKKSIDILVIMNEKWIPIELKYKTKGCTKIVDNETFNLKEHAAEPVNRYKYLKDIERIEKLKECVPEFEVGYTVFITNNLNYLKKEEGISREFSLEDGILKTGKMSWAKEASAGTTRDCDNPIELKGSYPINWKEYSKLDEENTGTFMYLINKISK